MSRLSDLARLAKANGRPVYLPYVMLGYPTPERSLELCRTLLANGADGLELGLPFRDPVADGPVIQQAGNVALDNGFTTYAAVQLVREIRAVSATAPLTLMAYYNMVLARGADQFIGDFAASGIDALLVPDLPPEHLHEVAGISHSHGVDTVAIASPLTDDARMAKIATFASGFVYVVTRLGITGTDERYAADLKGLFDRVHRAVGVPAIAGFGISGPDQARRMVEAGADGVIVGTRLVEMITAAGDGPLDAIASHTGEMTTALATISQPL